MALNLDGRAQLQPEQAIAKGKPSVLDKLKATPVKNATKISANFKGQER